jgi:hypothetical protein
MGEYFGLRKELGPALRRLWVRQTNKTRVHLERMLSTIIKLKFGAALKACTGNKVSLNKYLGLISPEAPGNSLFSVPE